MAQKLDANLNVIQETPIELELINGDLSIISKLDDEPNDVGGLSSTQLKAKFDEAGNTIKDYLNNSLIPAVLAADATEATRSAAEAERVENEVERVANENVRVPAETARIAAENIRIENEATRVENEEDRIDAEATRKANEAQRIINENAREDLETGYVARAEAAAKRAEDAAAEAENTVGGDYVTQEELDAAIGAIPTPDVYTKEETLTDDTKAAFGLGGNAVPNDVFNVLSNGVLSQRGSKYPLVTSFGDLPVGTKVPLNVDGVAKNFIVVHQGNPDTNIYDASCTGTWLMQEETAVSNKYNSTNSANYSGSYVNTYLNSTYLTKLDSAVQGVIATVKLPYTNAATVYKGANGLSTKVFLPSANEIYTASHLLADGATLDYFADIAASETSAKRIAYYSDGNKTNWWTRSAYYAGDNSVLYVNSSGGFARQGANQTATYRPMFIIPNDADVSFLGFYNVNGTLKTTTVYGNVLTDVLGNTLAISSTQITDLGGAKIATGSYTGNGTCDLANKNTLTFDFEPKIVFVCGGNYFLTLMRWSGVGSSQYILSADNTTGELYGVYASFDGTTASWYNTRSPNHQCNINGRTYYYFAIG